MFSRQLFAIAISTLISINPVYPWDWEGEKIDFPFFRTDTVVWRLSFDIDDLGPVSNGASNHNYGVTYNYFIECSGPCRIEIPVADNLAQVNENYYTFSIYTQYYNHTPTQMLQKIEAGNKGRTISDGYTYQNAEDVHEIDVTLENFDGSWVLHTYFSPISEGNLLGAIYYYVRNFDRNWLIQQMLNRNNPSSVTETLQQYIEDGDYTGATNYIYNYYYQNTVDDIENKEATVSENTTKKDELETVFQTENNFTSGIENDFNSQMQNINTNNSVINDSNFLSSANWVKQQFDRMTNNNALGAVLSFSLIVGLALALLGRFFG